MVRTAAIALITALLATTAQAQEVVECPPKGTAARDRFVSDGSICADDVKERVTAEANRRAFLQRGVAFADRPVTPAMQARIRRLLDDVLNDEPSTRYRWPLRRHPDVYCFEINAKNRFGGYTGWTEYSVDTTVAGGVKGMGTANVFCEDLK